MRCTKARLSNRRLKGAVTRPETEPHTKGNYMKTKVTVLGLGLMGDPMARNIAGAGFDVTVWNRSAQKTNDLVGVVAEVAQSLEEASGDADVVISMVSDGQAMLGLVRRVLAQNALKDGAVWVDMSSTKPDEARKAADMLAQQRVGFLDAPVSGGSAGAKAGTLAIMVGGEETLFDRLHPVFSAMGRATRVGPTGAGQLAKLANQAIVGIGIAAVAEAMLLLEQGGADPAAVRAALKGGFADSTILQQHGARMSHRDFTPGGLSQTQLKDMDNVLAQAGDLELPLVRQVRDRYARYVSELGGAGRDHAGLFEELLDLNGLLEN